MLRIDSFSFHGYPRVSNEILFFFILLFFFYIYIIYSYTLLYYRRLAVIVYITTVSHSFFLRFIFLFLNFFIIFFSFVNYISLLQAIVSNEIGVGTYVYARPGIYSHSRLRGRGPASDGIIPIGYSYNNDHYTLVRGQWVSFPLHIKPIGVYFITYCNLRVNEFIKILKTELSPQ